jgi:predicted amidophosphoribosyltransferase
MLRGTFSVPEGAESIIRGKNVILVDDVCTTASTAEACAEVLKDAGAEKVFLLCFASSAGPAAAPEEQPDMG